MRRQNEPKEVFVRRNTDHARCHSIWLADGAVRSRAGFDSMIELPVVRDAQFDFVFPLWAGDFDVFPFVVFQFVTQVITDSRIRRGSPMNCRTRLFCAGNKKHESMATINPWPHPTWRVVDVRRNRGNLPFD